MITHKRFIAEYNKYPNFRIVKYFCNYFLSGQKLFKSITLFAQVILIDLLLFIKIFILNDPTRLYLINGIIVLNAVALLFYMIIAMAYWLNKRREKKIIKILRVTRSEYYRLTEIYQMKI